MIKITQKIKEDPYRLGFHLMPPTGWMNDPNGLCEFDGKYHVFFQYSPDDVKGGCKEWGHYSGDDLLHFRFAGTAVSPDHAADAGGAFSGSALIDDGEMLLYYTGNVELPGDYDHTYAGRESNTILLRSRDGEHFSEKQVLLTNADYPDEYTCHVRDPKVWKQDGKYYMVQGGRLDGRRLELRRLQMDVEQKDSDPLSNDITAGNGSLLDQGAVIVFEGEDALNFQPIYSITTAEPFGYMWECPDYFELDGKKYLSCCPQGLEQQEYKWQNTYQSGYFILPEGFDITDPARGTLLVGDKLPENPGTYRLLEDPEGTFREWDYGFDFYAPQTFTDSRGRRILIGWVGMFDADYDNLHTTERGWQHALSVPRVLTSYEGGIRQWPAEEIESLRLGLRVTEKGDTKLELPTRKADILVERENGLGYSGKIFFDRAREEDGLGVEMGADGKLREYLLLMRLWVAAWPVFEIFLESAEGAPDTFVLHLMVEDHPGRGRKERKVRLKDFHKIRVLIDTSMAEIFVNDGEQVMTTRFYVEEEVAVNSYRLQVGPPMVKVWDMKNMRVDYE